MNAQIEAGEQLAGRYEVTRYRIVLERAVTFRLTPSEQRILSLLSEGLGTRAIGERLGITEGTVRSHISSLERKFAVTGRAQLLLTAFEEGVIAHQSWQN